MYAIIESGGKQYRVHLKQRVKIERLETNEGDDISFDRVLLLGCGDQVQIGVPYVAKAEVSARVLKHGRGKKISVLKFKRRKHHMKRLGHRQWFTEVEITAIGDHKAITADN